MEFLSFKLVAITNSRMLIWLNIKGTALHLTAGPWVWEYKVSIPILRAVGSIKVLYMGLEIKINGERIGVNGRVNHASTATIQDTKRKLSSFIVLFYLIQITDWTANPKGFGQLILGNSNIKFQWHQCTTLHAILPVDQSSHPQHKKVTT